MIKISNDIRFTEKDFRDYIAAFNRNDFEGFAQYYTDNIIFEGRGRHFKSRDEVLNFYRTVKSRMRETITIKEVIVGENDMTVEIETELSAFEDWLDMPTGPIHKGEVIRSQSFVWYKIENKKFVHIRSARYRRVGASEPSAVEKPPDYSPAAPPAINKKQFIAYINAVNNNNISVINEYLHDDIVLVIAGEKELRGRQAVSEFYKMLRMQTKHTIQINKLITSGNMLAADLQSEFIALQDLPDFFAGPMKNGSRVSINIFVLYNLRDSKFSRMRSAEFRKVEHQ
jgi:ketosteroid isomerase-like protein